MMVWQKLMSAPAAAGGYSCNLTVGNFSGAVYGYDTEDGLGLSIGSIDAEPVPGFTMATAAWSGTDLSIYFIGDCLSLVTSLNVYIDSVNRGGAGSWVYNSAIPGYTTLDRTVTIGITSGTYLFEIK
jgi:hypothetical protein